MIARATVSITTVSITTVSITTVSTTVDTISHSIQFDIRMRWFALLSLSLILSLLLPMSEFMLSSSSFHASLSSLIPESHPCVLSLSALNSYISYSFILLLELHRFYLMQYCYTKIGRCLRIESFSNSLQRVVIAT
jgi:hypothetical protein